MSQSVTLTKTSGSSINKFEEESCYKQLVAHSKGCLQIDVSIWDITKRIGRTTLGLYGEICVLF